MFSKDELVTRIVAELTDEEGFARLDADIRHARDAATYVDELGDADQLHIDDAKTPAEQRRLSHLRLRTGSFRKVVVDDANQLWPLISGDSSPESWITPEGWEVFGRRLYDDAQEAGLNPKIEETNVIERARYASRLEVLEAEGGTGGAGRFSMREPPGPYLYSQAEAMRTTFREIRQNKDNSKRIRRWAGIMESALNAAMFQTLARRLPEQAEAIRAMYDFVREHEEILGTHFAKFFARNLDRLYSLNDQADVDRAKWIVDSLLRPGQASVKQIQLLKKLAREPEGHIAFSLLQRAFVGQILGAGLTPLGKLLAGPQFAGTHSARTAGLEADPFKAFRGSGVLGEISKFMDALGSYGDDVLVEMLGEPMVRSLYDFGALLQGLGNVAKIAEGSQTNFLFWERAAQHFNDYFGRDKLAGVLARVIVPFAVAGSVGSVAGAGAVFWMGELFAGVAGIVTQWLTSVAGGSVQRKLGGDKLEDLISDKQFLDGVTAQMIRNIMWHKPPVAGLGEAGVANRRAMLHFAGTLGRLPAEPNVQPVDPIPKNVSKRDD